MNALVYVDIDQGIHKVKVYSCTIWKTKKTTWVFLYIKYSKVWSVLLEHFVERKPLISEECSALHFMVFDGFICASFVFIGVLEYPICLRKLPLNLRHILRGMVQKASVECSSAILYYATIFLLPYIFLRIWIVINLLLPNYSSSAVSIFTNALLMFCVLVHCKNIILVSFA